MSKIKLTQNIGQRITGIPISWEKGRPIGQEGVNGRALDP